MQKRITAILWDVDNTLLDFEYSMRNSLKECFQLFGISVTEEMIQKYSQINDLYWKRLERKEVTKQELLNGRFIDLFREFQLEDIDVVRFRTEYQDCLGKIYSFTENSLTVCKDLQTKVKQYVVTNGVASTQRSKLKLSGLEELMNGIFISEEIGFPKPDKDFFEFCLTHIDEQDRERILIIGDSLTSDIQGGNNVGIKTCWYNPKHETKKDGYKVDYEIVSLREIYDILEEG